jgi:hypothetical protein
VKYLVLSLLEFNISNGFAVHDLVHVCFAHEQKIVPTWLEDIWRVPTVEDDDNIVGRHTLWTEAKTTSRG